MKAVTQRFASLMLCALAAQLWLVACSSPHDEAAQPLSADSFARPASVSPALWSQLTAELERVLAAEGRDRTTSAAPVGPGSVIGNLNMYMSGFDQTFYFSYRNQGDYDLNGLVTIADLTPIGIHF